MWVGSAWKHGGESPHFILYKRGNRNLNENQRQERKKEQFGYTLKIATNNNKMVYSNKEFSHLKWRLMNQDRLSEKEAEKRIKKIKEWDKKIKTDKKNGKQS